MILGAEERIPGMENPYGSYEAQCDDFVDPRQEHEDFEAGAENMELRAMRLEAERANEIEAAMYEAEEAARLEAALDEIGATHEEYEAARALSKAFESMSYRPHIPTDDSDIPF